MSHDGELSAPSPHANGIWGIDSLAGEIDGELHKRRFSLRFEKRLEAMFEADTKDARSRHLIVAGIAGLTMYLAFLFTDYTLMRDVFGQALFVRLGVVAPITIGVMAALAVGMEPAVREFIDTTAVLLATGSIMYLVKSSAQFHIAYQYFPGIMLAMTFALVVIRLRFPYAVAFSAACLAAYVPALRTLDMTSAANLALIMGVNALSALYANYSLERDLRRSYLISLRDQTRAAKLTVENSALDVLTRVDPLTGVSNRRDLDHVLETIVPSAQRPVALIVFDVDHFKQFNDTHGHPTGDECLRMIAEQIRESMRHRGDLVARVGGDEFAAVLQDADISVAFATANRIRASIDLATMADGPEGPLCRITISAGVAVADDPSSSASLMQSADAALYRAKQQGRNRVSV